MARILIVDDSLFTRRSLREMLTQAGHNIVAEASNGIAAFSEYSALRPDIVTMDLTMPLSDGLEAIKKILDTYKEAKIIVISAMAQKAIVFEALQLGAKHYIIKPFIKEKVLTIIDFVLTENC